MVGFVQTIIYFTANTVKSAKGCIARAFGKIRNPDLKLTKMEAVVARGRRRKVRYQKTG